MFDFVRKLFFARQLVMERGKITVLDQPLIIFPAWVLVYLLKDSKNFNKTAFELYNATKKSTYQNFTKELLEKYKLDPRSLFEWMTNIAEFAGLGIFNFINLDFKKNEAVFVVNDSTIAKLYGKSKKPLDHYIRGLAAGVGNVCFNRNDMECIETKCISQGYPRCEFLGRPLKNFSKKDKVVREQLGLK